MNIYPTEPKSMMRLVVYSFTNYSQVLKAIIPMILLATFVKDIYIYWGGMPDIQIIRMMIIIVMVILEIYFWLAALYSANEILTGQSMPVKTVFHTVYYKWSSIYAGVFAFILGWCMVFFVGYLISMIFIAIFPDKILARALTYLILIGIPLTIGIVLCFFAIPILTVSSVNTMVAFRESVRLVSYKNWLRTFTAYAAILITALIVSPATRHGHWLRVHYLSFLFDAAVLILLAPLIINFILLLLNDLRLRHSQQLRKNEKKSI